MKKVSTLSAYTLLGMFLCFCTLVEAQDFKIQEVQDDVDNSGIPGASGYAEVTNTTTGFTAVSSTKQLSGKSASSGSIVTSVPCALKAVTYAL